MRIGIRLRTILLVFPLILGSLAFIGASSLLSARKGVSRLAMSALSFKAELVRQYADYQWNLVQKQGYAEDPEFRGAVARSIADYARSLLRSPTEWVCALSLDGGLALDVCLGGPRGVIPPALLEAMRAGATGPLVFGEGRSRSYGQAFYFAPLGWYVAVSETSDAIFAETDQLTRTVLAGFAGSLLLSLLLLFLLSGSIVRPVLRVREGMADIVASGRFEARIEPERDDEVGDLTLQFNTLCGELERSYGRIRDIARKEIEARLLLADHELEAIIALGKMAEFRDEDTASHIVRVGLYSKILGDLFYDSALDRESLFYAAPLHDLGKIGVPDSILLKPAALEPSEMALMRRHCEIGYEILREFRNPALVMGGEIALSHHERFDGKGYPKGLVGKQIPLSGRILAVVDVFDALTSARPYKKAWPVEEALAYISQQRGGHFDPEIAEAFLDHREELLSIKGSVAADRV